MVELHREGSAACAAGLFCVGLVWSEFGNKDEALKQMYGWSEGKWCFKDLIGVTKPKLQN